MLLTNALKPGQEQHESFKSSIYKKTLFQYDYRANDGELFSCVGKSLEECRTKRDIWQTKRLTK